jgi:hypothetical protein
MCHSKTKNIEEITRQADILIVAIGQPQFVKANMVKEGAVVIDVGIHRIKDDSEKGYHIVGDVDFDEVYPKVISEAYQVFECTWVKELDNASGDKIQDEYEGPYHDFNGITSKYGAHFILKIDHILMKEKYYNAIINGVTSNNFAPLPTNWGYRDSKNFWCSDFKKAKSEGIPDKEVDLTSIRYAADRVDDKVKFTDDALKMLVKVPRPFLKLVLTGCVNWAKENNCTLITEKEIAIINDKRSKEKKK